MRLSKQIATVQKVVPKLLVSGLKTARVGFENCSCVIFENCMRDFSLGSPKFVSLRDKREQPLRLHEQGFQNRASKYSDKSESSRWGRCPVL